MQVEIPDCSGHSNNYASWIGNEEKAVTGTLFMGGQVMEYEPITVVGIDVSKGKSTVAVCRPGGQVILSP